MDRNSEIREILTRFSGRVPVDVVRLALALGLTVLTDTSMSKDEAGKIVRDNKKSPAGFTIFLNGNDAPRRRRFTLAHEVAHYVLHRDLIGDGLIDSAMYRSKLSDVYERQANRLAANILMPETLVRAYFSGGSQSPHLLAQTFDVSDQAMSIRLDELRLSGQQQRPVVFA